MADFVIFYGDETTYRGSTRTHWRAAPSTDVQAVVLLQPYPDYTPELPLRPWKGVSDRMIWTGDDTYNLNGWGQKLGKLIDLGLYERIARRAFYDLL